MTRRVKTSVGDLAESVLAHVEREQLVKTAALAHISKAPVTSLLGQLLEKTAARVRQEANAEISYADLAEFRKKYDV